MRTRRIVTWITALLIVAASGLAIREYAFATPLPTFRFVTVERGDLQAVVSATGTLSALTTVSVGTQVSGQVSALYADFNDQVKKGQLLARIDPTILQQAVSDAQANLEKLRAQTVQARLDQERNRELVSQGLIPASDADKTGSALRVAEAAEKSASISLQRAQQNLTYTSILAPIDGIVVERNVNNGQTVAASLQAPQLFLIANDLSQMQILAHVGESDIVRIRQGQAVRFSVQAIPNRTFTGTVQQVRLQSTTVDNVVNYTVVVKLENPDRELLPGMTARVDFLVQSVSGVLKVPNAALRYKPSEDVLTRLAPSATASPSPGGSPRTARGPGGTGGARDQRAASAEGRSFGTLYAVGPDGRLQTLRVRTGLSDGSATEIEGRGVTEGLKVIAGAVTAQASTASQTANPLAGTQSPRGRPPGGPGGIF